VIVTFWDTLFSLNLWNGIEYTLKLDTVDTMQDPHCVGHNVEYMYLCGMGYNVEYSTAGIATL
jgi:hypothetical protein